MTGPVYQMQNYASQPTDPVLVTVGDMICTQHWLVTPAGTVPMAGVQWTVVDLTRVEQHTPTWAVVLAVLFFLFCLLGLLFLLAKESRIVGTLQVTAQRDRFLHSTQSWVSSPSEINDIHSRVNYARSLSLAAS